MRRTKMRAVLTAVGTMMVFGAVTFVLWQGAHRVLADEMTGGELSQFLIYAVYVAISAASLSEMWGEVQRAAGAMERLVELQERDAGDRRAAESADVSDAAARAHPLRERLVPLSVAARLAGARRLLARHRAGRERRVRRPLGRGQEHDVPAAAALLRSRVRARHHRRRRHREGAAGRRARAHRPGAAGNRAVRHQRAREHSLRPPGRDRCGNRSRRARRRRRRVHPRSCRRATTRSSANAARACPAANASASPSPARC